jgi:hypothetical protein
MRTGMWFLGEIAARAYYRTGLLVDNTSPQPAHSKNSLISIYKISLTYFENTSVTTSRNWFPAGVSS